MADQVDEQRELHQLKRALAEVDPWLERVGCADWEVSAGSPLAGDDRKSDPFQISHAVRMALLVAVDHAHCLRRAIEGCDACAPHEMTLLLNSYYSLLRGAIENGARAVWLLCPDSRPERLRRRFRLQADNVRQSDAACAVGGIPRNKPKDQRIARIQEIAIRADLSSTAAVERLSNKEIVRAAGAYVVGNDGGADHAECVWRACSAAAHGDVWAALSLHDREVVEKSAGMATLHLEASTRALTTMAVESLAVIKVGFYLHDLRNRSLY